VSGTGLTAPKHRLLSWICLAAMGAGGLALLAVLVFRNSTEPGHGARGRSDHDPPPERRDDPVKPERPKRIPGGSLNEVEDDDNRSKPNPGTERWHYEEFLRLAAADQGGFDRLVDEKIRSEAPLQERVALLRAAWKVRGSEALRWFSGAFAAGGAGPQDRAADALRGFVVRHLASHARAVADVREFLKEKVFLDEAVNTRDRSAAGRAVLEAADPGEISTLLEAIRRISDSDIAEGALIGLGLNDHAAAASALTWLSNNHPRKHVRDRAAEVSRQRLARNVGEEEED